MSVRYALLKVLKCVFSVFYCSFLTKHHVSKLSIFFFSSSQFKKMKICWMAVVVFFITHGDFRHFKLHKMIDDNAMLWCMVLSFFAKMKNSSRIFSSSSTTLKLPMKDYIPYIFDLKRMCSTIRFCAGKLCLAALLFCSCSHKNEILSNDQIQDFWLLLQIFI
jgi:hypothetical protein